MDETERGRELYARRDWADAFASLSRAARAAPDLELLATSAYMLGRDADYFDALERAHHAHLDAGNRLRAAYCALWMGINLMLQREVGPATGWIARAQRLVDRENRDCVERGYLLIPVWLEQMGAGDYEAAHATAAAAAELGERFGDRDIASRARDQRAHGRPPPTEHFREARCLVADRRERVRLRARPRWSWSILATPRLTARWWI